MALPKLALHPALVKVILQISIYITEAYRQQVVKSFVHTIRFMINAVSYPLDGNFIFVFATITA
jgi:hypothetical protein